MAAVAFNDCPSALICINSSILAARDDSLSPIMCPCTSDELEISSPNVANSAAVINVDLRNCSNTFVCEIALLLKSACDTPSFALVLILDAAASAASLPNTPKLAKTSVTLVNSLLNWSKFL